MPNVTTELGHDQASATAELIQNSISQRSSPAQLVLAIRGLRQDMEDAERSHCHSALWKALRYGDALAWLRAQVPPREWPTWRDNTGTEQRTDEDYRRLAKHRARIEQAQAENPGLSIRAALTLLRGAARPKRKKTKPAVGWDALSDEAKQAGLASDGVNAFLGYLPSDLRTELADHVARVDARQKTVIDRRLTELFRKHIETLDPKDPVAEFIRENGIDLSRVTVRVSAADAPAKRPRPLVGTNSNVVPFSPASPSTPPPQ